MQISLYERNNRLYVSYKEDGKRVRKSLNLKATKGNIAYAYKELMPKLNNRLERGISPTSDLSIRYFTTKILHNAKTELKPNTYKTYLTAINKFFTFFNKEKPIANFRIKDVDDYIISLRLQGKKTKTISAYLAPISTAFEEAIRLEIIDKNPTSHTKRPRADKKETKPYNLLQMHTLLREAKGELKTFLYLAFYTGARAGEILALRWENIGLNTIDIKKTKHANGELGTPKTGKSRTILCPEPLKKYLSSLEQTEDFVLKLNYHSARRNFQQLLKNLGYEIQGLHATRHTFTSLLVQNNVSPTLIAQMLGHSSLTMINNIYAKYIEGNNTTNQALLNNALAQS